MPSPCLEALAPGMLKSASSIRVKAKSRMDWRTKDGTDAPAIEIFQTQPMSTAISGEETFAARRRINLSDLLKIGLLKPGEDLICEPRRGEIYHASLNRDGRISYLGDIFNTPSDFAQKVAGNSRNGWKDVYVRKEPLSWYRDQISTSKTKPYLS